MCKIDFHSIHSSSFSQSSAASDGMLYRITCRANELFERHCYKEAITEYTRALIKSKPAIDETGATDFIALIFANRSGAYCMLRQFEEAYKDAEIVIRLKPEWSQGYFRAGESLLGLRRYKEACLSYEKTLILDPKCQEARLNLLRSRFHKENGEMGT
ncbi:hypothetical protein K7432_014693 [Basidiobolus ranarum]|uniref:Uncharacterized protein n=1 Tax=Basidiobolus ranarum TaxID=34480 RepID=A0ABR2WH82_9FUNG